MFMRDVNLVVNAFHSTCLNVVMTQHFYSSVAGGRDRSFFPWFRTWVSTQICFSHPMMSCFIPPTNLGPER